MRTGDRVVLHSLIRSDLNGRYATVLLPSMDFNGRYHVRLEDNMSEVKVKHTNMIRIRTVPQDVLDVDEEGSDAPETSSLVRGDCVVCLGEEAATEVIVPCGHLVLCGRCAPRTRAVHGKCPLCRGPMLDLVNFCAPSGHRDEEMRKSVERYRSAEKRVRELEGDVSNMTVKAERPSKRAKTTVLAKGYWLKMPSGRKMPAGAPTEAVTAARLHGEVVEINETFLTVRFHGVDEELYAKQGHIRPSRNVYKDIILPLAFPIAKAYTPEQAMWQLSMQEKNCVFPHLKELRKMHVCNKKIYSVPEIVL